MCVFFTNATIHFLSVVAIANQIFQRIGAGQPVKELQFRNIRILFRYNILCKQKRDKNTYGKHYTFAHPYCRHNHLDQNIQLLLSDTVHFHNAADNTCWCGTSLSRTISGIDQALLLHYISGPVRHCHPCKQSVNYRIRTLANIHHYCSGMFDQDT